MNNSAPSRKQQVAVGVLLLLCVAVLLAFVQVVNSVARHGVPAHSVAGDNAADSSARAP